MLTPEAPPARSVISPDGTKIATYEFGDPDAPTVLAVHGFASSAFLNWHAAGWMRDLLRNGFHVIAIDQRGHGASDKPHSPDAYTMGTLVTDVLTVLDTFMLDEVAYVGYSLGARVGWEAARELPERITRAVLGGIPDGDPLTRFRIDEARGHIDHGHPVTDRLTGAYLQMARGIEGNDLAALVALVEGMRGGPSRTPTTRRSSRCCSLPAAKTASCRPPGPWHWRLRANSSRSQAATTSTPRPRGLSAMPRSPSCAPRIEPVGIPTPRCP